MDKQNNIEEIKHKVKEVKDQGKKFINSVADIMNKSSQQQFIEIIILIMIGLIIVIFIVWAYTLSTLQYRDCNNIDKIYSNNNTFNIGPIATFDPFLQNVVGEPGLKFKFQNSIFNPENGNARVFFYYSKTAFNACSPGNFSNSFVSICALRNNIQLGARCLDFEIYSVNSEPVISSSSVSNSLPNSFFTKETFNYIKLTDVLLFIRYFALENANGGAQNYTDPLFLHFRIMTTRTQTINLIAKYLKEILSNHLLHAGFGQNNNNTSIRSLSLVSLCRKCIIMVNKNNTMQNDTTIIQSNLWGLINVFTGTDNYRFYRFSEINNMDEYQLDELAVFNKTNMSVVIPDPNHRNSNFDPTLAFRTGCQFIAMNTQTFDSNLETYFSIFNQIQFNFVLKPCSLRHTPTHVIVDDSHQSSGGMCAVRTRISV